MNDLPKSSIPPLLHIFDAMANPRKSNGYTLYNRVKIVRGGADYFECIETLADHAKYTLHLQTYIFDEDATGTRVAEALIRAARRNVKVYLLVDGYASQHLSAAFRARLAFAGVNFAFFQPFLKSENFYIGRRMHHKIMVADGRYCLVAGINISDRYNDIGDVKAWLDWAVVAEGEVAKGIHGVCERVWNGSLLRKKCKIALHPEMPEVREVCEVRMRRNDWVYKRTEITRSYREVFHLAQKEVTMMTSYFWPPRKLLKRMGAAARRGVNIRLVLTAKADVPFSKYAEKYLYQWLFRNHIEIYEYQKNVLHGKITVYDGKWLTAGSYNLNNISAYASMELNLDIKNEAIAGEVTRQLQSIMENDCVQITEAQFAASNNLVSRMFFYLSYRIIHIIFYLFTFYFRQRGEGR